MAAAGATEEGLQFDRFASLYSRVRPTYPPRVFRALADTLAQSSDGARAGVAVDLGCGSGQSLAGLLTIADRVVGVEPAARLRAEAEAAYPGATLMAGSGEAIPLPASSADIVTVANAFYWMDMRATLAEVDRVLKRPGVFATYKYDVPKLHSTGGDRVFRAHLGQHWDAHRSRKLTDVDPTADLMRASGYFASVAQPVIPYTLRYTVRGFAEFMSSTSYVRAHADGTDDPRGYLDRFTNELREGTGSDEVDVSLVLFMNVGVKR